MKDLKLCESDYRFMLLVWEAEPLPSGKLVELCWERLGWKKSTTYTVIKKLCEKGYIANEHAMVKALVSREKVQQQESDYFVRRTFGGSLPGFLTAFLGNRRLSEDEARELEELIARHKEGS